ncbi:MAG: hypothetical protein Q7S09_03045 [bacterium]|nr:hypothetical protein [bacterium]
MNQRLFFLFHVHSDRSHDSSTTVQEYVAYLEKILKENEYAILGISDHNVVPLLIDQAMSFSTKKVLVVPGIQWKIKKGLADGILKLVTRRELLTFGDHDDLKASIEKLHHRILPNKEIFANLTEGELLDYISHKREMIIIVPHPKHFVVDYYGKKQIKRLKKELDERRINLPFFIEDRTGNDPFPRIFCTYKGKYLTIGNPDAHEIFSVLGTKSLFSVETILDIPENERVITLWRETLRTNNHDRYRETILAIFGLLVMRNENIYVKKHYLRAWIHFFHSVPMFIKRRFGNFPHNLLR